MDEQQALASLSPEEVEVPVVGSGGRVAESSAIHAGVRCKIDITAVCVRSAEAVSPAVEVSAQARVVSTR